MKSKPRLRIALVVLVVAVFVGVLGKEVGPEFFPVEIINDEEFATYNTAR